jgi:NAD(P)-dependent dehydrogenase (short-subunit alcohol dehydrogenase family)
MNDLFSLQGRTALITGGSRGIGEMMAEGFLRAGAKVYISARKAGPCEATARRLAEYGTCIALPVDAAGADGARNMAARYLEHESDLDILVNNAGAAWGEPFATFSEGGWDKVVDLNLKTPFFLTQALYGALKSSAAKGTPAKVINIASVDGMSINMQETYSYAASKAGLIHLTKRMALTLIDDNIIVNAIAPGAFPSDMNREARDDDGRLAKLIPAKRIGDKEDMMGTAVYLAARAGNYVVGSTIVLDGGLTWHR